MVPIIVIIVILLLIIILLFIGIIARPADSRNGQALQTQ